MRTVKRNKNFAAVKIALDTVETWSHAVLIIG
jgi:hypothetical protein